MLPLKVSVSRQEDEDQSKEEKWNENDVDDHSYAEGKGPTNNGKEPAEYTVRSDRGAVHGGLDEFWIGAVFKSHIVIVFIH